MGKTIVLNAAPQPQMIQQQPLTPQQLAAAADTGRVNRMEIKLKKGGAVDSGAVVANVVTSQPQILQRVVIGQTGAEGDKQQMTPSQIGELLNKKFSKQVTI